MHLNLLSAFGFSVKAGDEHLVFGLHEHEGVVRGRAVLVQLEGGADIVLHYKVSLFVSIEPERAAQVPDEVQLVVGGRPPVESPLVLVKQYFETEADGAEPAPETLLLGGLVIRVDGIVKGGPGVPAYE